MLRLAWPVLVEQTLALSIGFSDRMLTGHYLQTSHLAAITLIAYLLWATYGIFSVVAIGATAMVARAVGAGNYRLARKVMTQAFLLGGLVAAVAVIFVGRYAEEAVRLLQLEGESATLAVAFVKFLLPAIPLIMLDAVGIACLRAAGDTVTGLCIMSLVNAVNLSVSWLLVLGPGPVPRLGWTGIAMGTLSGYTVGGLALLTLLLRGRSGLKIEWANLRPDLGILRRLLWVGLPGGADTLSVIGCQLWFLAVINRLGTSATAAHGVALSVESIIFPPAIALQMAAATMTGQHLGARNHRQASRSGWAACGLGALMMALGGLMLYFEAERLTPLLVNSQQSSVATLAAPLVRTVAIGMPALGITLILTGALRGAGDTRWPLLFSLIGLLGVRLPAAYWLAFPEVHLPVLNVAIAGWGLGVLGTWYAMVSDLSVRASLVLFRFWQGGWRQIEV